MRQVVTNANNIREFISEGGGGVGDPDPNSQSLYVSQERQICKKCLILWISALDTKVQFSL